MQRRRSVFGALIIGLVLSVAVSVFVPAAIPVGAVFTVAAGIIGITLVQRGPRIVAFILIGVGIASLTASIIITGTVDVPGLFTINQDIIGMIAAVSFIRLVTAQPAEKPPRLSGRAAIYRTAFATHIFGAAINISAVGIVGDRLSRNGTLRLAEAKLLGRSFLIGAYWSPLWAASAAAALYVHGANQLVLIVVGLGLALLTISLTMFDVVRGFGPGLSEYRGYEFSWRLVRIPLALMALVIIGHELVPIVPVPRIVVISAIVITAIGLFIAAPRQAIGRMVTHATTQFRGLQGEVTLFAAAGILGVGLHSLLPVFHLALPFGSFSVPVAWGMIVAMIVLSAVGIHPIVAVALIAALTLPLNPDPTLFVLALSVGWGTSLAVGPLSGTSMFLNARYGISPTEFTRGNLIFVVTVLVLSWPALYLCALLVGFA